MNLIASTISLAEVFALPALHQQPLLLRSLAVAIAAIPGIDLVPLDEHIAVLTAAIRTQTALKLPDAAIVATAQAFNCNAIIGNDRQWRHRQLGLPYLHLDDLLDDDPHGTS